MNLGNDPSNWLVSCSYAISITFPTAPLNNPQSGTKFFPVICTLAPRQIFNIGSISDSLHKHLTRPLYLTPLD
jgi:hypothetical protein